MLTSRRDWSQVLRVMLSALFTVWVARPAHAQRMSDSTLSAPIAWLDATIGPTMTGGGQYAFNGSLGGSGTLTLRLPRGLEVAGSAFASGRGRWFGSCIASGVVGARACAGFPAVTGWSASLAIAERGFRQQVGAHFGVGAGDYRLKQPWTGAVAHATGYHLDLGGASPVWHHFGITSDMRVIVIPHVFGRTHWVAPLTFGARIW